MFPIGSYLSFTVLDRQRAEQVVQHDGQVGGRTALVHAALITCNAVDSIQNPTCWKTKSKRSEIQIHHPGCNSRHAREPRHERGLTW